MKFPKSKSKTNFTQLAKTLGMGIAGGFVGTQATSFLEKQSFMSDYADYAPAGTILLAVAGQMVMPSFKDVFNGAAIVAGTELLEGLVNTATKKTTNGLPMGFVPQYKPYGETVLGDDNQPLR